ncbi:MAG: hypothetical protein KBG21_00845 [Ignavibacteria bacterium]|nr:hypothetical protein [Ignavibacteria bacterium]
MKKTLLLVLLLITFGLNTILKADDDFTNAIVKAKTSLKTALDKYDEKEMIKARGQFERILQLKKNTWLVNYYLALCDYHIAVTAMESKDNEKIKKYTQSGLELVGKSLLDRDNFADTYVLKLSLDYNRFQYEMDKMQSIIADVTADEENAKKYDPTNPRLYLVKGVATFYTPAAFGGGVDKAQPLLEKSVELFGLIKNSDVTLPDWGEETAYAYMALCMLDQDKLTEAKAFLDKGLAINPNSKMLTGYVKKEYDDKVK